MVGFVSSPNLTEHKTGPHHPERPDRIRAIHKAVRAAGLITSEDPFPEFKIDLGIKPAGASALLEIAATAIDQRWLLAVHSPEYIARIEHVSRHGGVLDQGDTPVKPGSYETALLAVGAAINACDAVMTGQVKRAFVAARPPGHHAEPDRPMGFCLFANISIAARYLQQQYGIKRIAIVDFDVHHGNGTQAVFESDSSVLFISLHQNPRTCYPGTGFDWEIGTGDGKGFTLNIPFEPGSEDHDYLLAIEEKVMPCLDTFRPEILLLSAGFDGHHDDPLAQMNLSDDGFEQMTRLLVRVAEKHCDGKIVSVLEGGYNLAALGRSVVRHLIALRDEG